MIAALTKVGGALLTADEKSTLQQTMFPGGKLSSAVTAQSVANICGIAGLSDAGRWRGYREEITVRHRYFAAWRCWCWDALSVVRYLRKKIVRSFARH